MKKTSSSTKTSASRGAKKSLPKKTPRPSSASQEPSNSFTPKTPKDGVRILGVLHVLGNLFSGGLLGIVLVAIYLLVHKDSLSSLERDTCYEIINFNISFLLYTFGAGILCFILIGFILLPLVLVTWFVLMILGFIRHLNGENYSYPLVIRFLS